MNASSNHKYLHISIIVCLCLTVRAIGGMSFYSCNSKRNNEIDSKLRNEIHILNDKLVQAIFQRNSASVLSMMSGPLIASLGSNVDAFVPQIAESMSSTKYAEQLEYHSICSKPESPLFLPSGKLTDDKYSLSILSKTQESFESIISLDESLSLLVVYSKYENDWRINILRAGELKSGKLSSPEYFKLAKSSSKSGDMIDAILYSTMAVQLLHPFLNMFKYEIQDEAEALHKNIINEASKKYNFPISIKSISSGPVIFQLSPYVVNDTLYPMISYHSKISFDDTDALRQEYEMVKIQANATFPGISNNRKAVLYRAYANIPVGAEPVRSYGFVDQLK